MFSTNNRRSVRRGSDQRRRNGRGADGVGERVARLGSSADGEGERGRGRDRAATATDLQRGDRAVLVRDPRRRSSVRRRFETAARHRRFLRSAESL